MRGLRKPFLGINKGFDYISMELVSVVINCLNGEKFLREAMDSVVAQTYPNWEVIFWDNASTDRSREIALSYGDRVRYFKSENKLSLGEARNRAFLKAGGDFIAILDADDIWLPEKLEKQVKLFKDPNVALTFTNAVSFDAKGEHYRAFKGAPTREKMIFADLLKNNFIWTLTMIFRRNALNRLDYLFDPEFEIVCDYDLTLRLARLYKTDYLNEVLAKWRMGPKAASELKSYIAARESIKLLSRLESSIPHLRVDHPREVQRYETLVSRKLAQEAWQKGDKKAVRSLLKDSWKGDLFSFLAYSGGWLMPRRLFAASVNTMQYLMYCWRRIVDKLIF